MIARARGHHPGRSPAERGSVLVLVAGLVAVAMLLVAVVTDVSTLFLDQRSLSATADGAASRAAQAVLAAGVYGQAPDAPALPVSTAAAVRAVEDYLGTRMADASPVRIVDVRSDGVTVTVVLAAEAKLPFSRWVSADPSGVEITAQARAQTVVAR